jgi:hypothetical protein
MLAAILLALPIPPASAADDRELGAAVDALWSSLSSAPGQGADDERLKALFHPKARVCGARERDGRATLEVQEASAFIQRQARPQPEGFHEREVHREVRAYGRFAQVLSTVESRRRPTDAAPLFTGINSLQLYRDEAGAWLILSLYYALEDPENPLPPPLRGSAGR